MLLYSWPAMKFSVLVVYTLPRAGPFSQEQPLTCEVPPVKLGGKMWQVCHLWPQMGILLAAFCGFGQQT